MKTKELQNEIDELTRRVKELERDQCHYHKRHGPLQFYDAHGVSKGAFGGYVRFICKNCGGILQVDMTPKMNKYFNSPNLINLFEEQPIKG